MNWSVIGHEPQKKYLERALKKDALVHAYLLTGPAMIGKRSLALDVIRAAHIGSEPGVNDPYTVLITDEERSSIPIEDIRKLKRVLTLRPPPGVQMMVLVDNAERMTTQAANALLKILEEPPSYVTFLLVSATPGQLPETVRSRCHDVPFLPVAEDEVRTFLSEQKVAAKDKDQLSVLAAGRVGWLKQVIDAKRVAEIVASACELQQQLKKGVAEHLIWAKKLAGREDVRELVLRWLAFYRSRLANEPELALRIHGLLELHDTLGQTQYNGRLAVEKFLLDQSGRQV
jgi:DNA polymerase-3 subunit delta'